MIPCRGHGGTDSEPNPSAAAQTIPCHSASLYTYKEAEKQFMISFSASPLLADVDPSGGATEPF